MLPIPAEIETLLKSKVMVGEHRPTGRIDIQDMPGDYSLNDPTAWNVWRTFIGDDSAPKRHGNMCETKDGRAIICYADGDATLKPVKIAYAPTVVGILDGTQAFDLATAVTVLDGINNPTARMALLDNHLCMVIVYTDISTGKLVAEYWRDQDGNGSGFTKIGTIEPECRPNIYWGTGFHGVMSLPHKLGDGTLVCFVPLLDIQDNCKLYRSSDDGLSWTGGASLRASSACVSESFLLLDDTTFIVAYLNNGGGGSLHKFSASGTVHEEFAWDTGWGEWPNRTPWYATFIKIGKKIYMTRYTELWGIDMLMFMHDDVILNSGSNNILAPTDWEQIAIIPCDYSSCSKSMVLTSKALILQHAFYLKSNISGAGVLVTKSTLQPKSITVDRSKGSASQATVIIDNRGGMYAPDPDGPWQYIIWPNNTVEIYMGYGAEQQLVFTGLIDEMTMSSYPAEISFTARDFAKRALDQMVQTTVDDNIVYGVTYQNQTLEYIFRDLATRAGWADADIITEATGITVAEITFSQQMYADCFQRLIELAAGFEWFCDEVGKIYFRVAVEPDPVAVYEYTEGVDIFSLGYKITDAEIYRTVVVIGEDADGNALSSAVQWPAADYYRLLPGKTLIVQATGQTLTQGQCDTLAQKAANATNPKPREVSFVVVGNPYLQIGDCLRVTETSSTISEIYRIFEMTQNLDAKGQPVFGTTVKCYHYASG